MLEGKPDEPGHVLIGQTVIEHHPLAPIGDKPQAPEEPKLMAHRRLACAERGRQVTDAQLPLREGPEDPQPTPVPQGLEEIGEPHSLFGLQGRVPRDRNQLTVDDPAGAPIFPLPTQATSPILSERLLKYTEKEGPGQVPGCYLIDWLSGNLLLSYELGHPYPYPPKGGKPFPFKGEGNS